MVFGSSLRGDHRTAPRSYKTSSGFFELAVAAPSMTAAAKAWGSRTNVFQQGLAKETRDPAIVTATMARPGVVLRRPVGSGGAFVEHARLPKHLPAGKADYEPAKARATRKEVPKRQADDKAARATALASEREQKRRETERRHRESKAFPSQGSASGVTTGEKGRSLLIASSFLARCERTKARRRQSGFFACPLRSIKPRRIEDVLGKPSGRRPKGKGIGFGRRPDAAQSS
jgi:hypothetical protein